MKTFKEYKDEGFAFVNEGKVSFGKMKFTTSASVDRQGVFVQFIPDSKTLDSYSKDEQIESIQTQLARVFPEMWKSLKYDSTSHAAGLTFRLDTYSFSDYLTKEINRMN